LLSGGAPRRRWQAVFGRPPPEHLTADLLRRMIAARIQEEAFGTLDRTTLGGGPSFNCPESSAASMTPVANGGPTLVS